MSTEFTHTIKPPLTRDSAQLPLRITLTAQFDKDGTIDTWGLAVNGHTQSAKNRTALHRILRGPCRDELPGGDHIGAGWYQHEAVQIWDKDYTWKIAAKPARAVADEIDLMIGRWSQEVKPKEVQAKEVQRDTSETRIAELEARVVELEGENRRLREMNAFLMQYAPR